MGFVLQDIVSIKGKPGLVLGAVVKHAPFHYNLVDQALVRSMKQEALSFYKSLGSDGPLLGIVPIPISEVRIAFPRGICVVKKFEVLLASKTSTGASFSSFYTKKGVFPSLFFLFLLGFFYFFFIKEEQWCYGREQKRTNQASGVFLRFLVFGDGLRLKEIGPCQKEKYPLAVLASPVVSLLMRFCTVVAEILLTSSTGDEYLLVLLNSALISADLPAAIEAPLIDVLDSMLRLRIYRGAENSVSAFTLRSK